MLDRISALSIPKIIILSSVIIFVFDFLVFETLSLFFDDKALLTRIAVDDYSFIIKVILVLLIGPILETWLFQKLPIDFLLGKNTNSRVIVPLSALLFALNHCYSIKYFVSTFVVGVFLAMIYLILNRYEQKKEHAFIVVVIVHAIQNLITLVFRHFG